MDKKRILLAGIAAAALLAAAGCTSDGAEKKAAPKPKAPGFAAPASAPRACTGGTYTWFNVSTPTVLTNVAKPQSLGKHGGMYTNPLKRLRTPVVAVRAEGPSLDSASVVRALAKYPGVLEGSDDELAGPGTPAPQPGEDTTNGTSQASVATIQYATLRLVAADFRYACPDGKTTVGTVRTWNDSSTMALVDCPDKVAQARKGTERDAVRLACAGHTGGMRKH